MKEKVQREGHNVGMFCLNVIWMCKYASYMPGSAASNTSTTQHNMQITCRKEDVWGD